MRIIAGMARGLKLHPPTGRDIRPTSDRVREALFNILMHRVEGSRFLDLFAGTGANGIEALSRGAEQAVFVEASPEGYQCIRNNLIHTKLNMGGLVLKHRLPEETDRIPGDFDIIFADPPYAGTDYGALLTAIEGQALLRPDGLCCIEHRKNVTLPESAGKLKLRRTRRYGDTALSEYQWETDEA